MKRTGVIVWGVLALAGLGAIAEWGCATTQPLDEVGGPPLEHVPDGGWASYVPSHREFEPDPARAAAGVTPQVSPFPATTSVGAVLR